MTATLAAIYKCLLSAQEGQPVSTAMTPSWGCPYQAMRLQSAMDCVRLVTDCLLAAVCTARSCWIWPTLSVFSALSTHCYLRHLSTAWLAPDNFTVARRGRSLGIRAQSKVIFLFWPVPPPELMDTRGLPSLPRPPPLPPPRPPRPAANCAFTPVALGRWSGCESGKLSCYIFLAGYMGSSAVGYQRHAHSAHACKGQEQLQQARQTACWPISHLRRPICPKSTTLEPIEHICAYQQPSQQGHELHCLKGLIILDQVKLQLTSAVTEAATPTTPPASTIEPAPTTPPAPVESSPTAPTTSPIPPAPPATPTTTPHIQVHLQVPPCSLAAIQLSSSFLHVAAM